MKLYSVTYSGPHYSNTQPVIGGRGLGLILDNGLGQAGRLADL